MIVESISGLFGTGWEPEEKEFRNEKERSEISYNSVSDLDTQ